MIASAIPTSAVSLPHFNSFHLTTIIFLSHCTNKPPLQAISQRKLLSPQVALTVLQLHKLPIIPERSLPKAHLLIDLICLTLISSQTIPSRQLSLSPIFRLRRWNARKSDSDLEATPLSPAQNPYTLPRFKAHILVSPYFYSVRGAFCPRIRADKSFTNATCHHIPIE